VFGLGCHIDAVRSTRRHKIFTFGHVWVTLAILLPVPASSGVDRPHRGGEVAPGWRGGRQGGRVRAGGVRREAGRSRRGEQAPDVGEGPRRDPGALDVEARGLGSRDRRRANREVLASLPGSSGGSPGPCGGDLWWGFECWSACGRRVGRSSFCAEGATRGNGTAVWGAKRWRGRRSASEPSGATWLGGKVASGGQPPRAPTGGDNVARHDQRGRGGAAGGAACQPVVTS